MTIPILGLHHVTAVAGDPPRNDDFFVRTLGMRRVKQTINFDDPGTYHLYFGDRAGRPGTLWTTFPHPRAQPHTRGTPEVARTTFAVEPGGLNDWATRLRDAGVAAEEVDDALHFDDPDGTRFGLREAAVPERYEPCTGDGVTGLSAIESVTLSVAEVGLAAAFLRDTFGFADGGESGLWVCGDGDAAQRVRLEEGGGAPPRLGAGGVHHVAFRVADGEVQEAARLELAAAGLHPTPVQDRQYFTSIYFRMPGGIIFEIATDGPGFDRDEPAESLGEKLQLPPWLEARREAITGGLVPLHDVKGDA